jgi:hypothetical protein
MPIDVKKLMAAAFPTIDTGFMVGKYILTLLSKFEGVKASNWAAVNADGEYRGKFDTPKSDDQGNPVPPEQRPMLPNYKPHKLSKYGGSAPGHIGLSWGWVQFTQSGGNLGKLAERMYELDPAAFNAVFGGTQSAAAMLSRLTDKDGGTDKADSSSHTGSAYWPLRCEPVNGAVLWEQPWLNRWLKSATIPMFQQAQVDIAIALIFNPAISKVAKPLGIKSQKGIAIVVDRAIQFGVTGCKNFLTPYFTKLAGKSEQAIFEYIYAKNKTAGWSHRLEKLLASDALTWEEVKAV